MIEDLFYELLRASIGIQSTLSKIPEEAEWKNLFDMAAKQSLVGICFVGLQNLGADADKGFSHIGISEDLYLTWMGMALQIQQKNEIINAQCTELQRIFVNNGLHSCILKGQSMAALYGDLSMLRQSGDIDIFVDCGRKKAIEYAYSIQDDVKWDYKHLHLKIFNDTEVEMHYTPEIFFNLRKNRKLQKWFRKPEVQRSMFHVTDEMVTPSVEFNLFYILLHAYRHFLTEGVGMRQLMDYYYVLKSSYQADKHLSMEAIESFKMERFASGVMWIMKEVFKLPRQLLLYNPNEKEGQYILREVMTGGNFGKYNESKQSLFSGKLAGHANMLWHNLHLMCMYPSEVLCAPIWMIYHWCWKRLQIVKNLF